MKKSVPNQVIDGILTAGLYMYALFVATVLSEMIYGPVGDVISLFSHSVVGAVLVGAFFLIIAANLRAAISGDKMQAGDLAAKVVVPLVIFVSVSAYLLPSRQAQVQVAAPPGWEVRELKGLWYIGFETSSFVPCGEGKPGYGKGYWLSTHDEESAQFVAQLKEWSERNPDFPILDAYLVFDGWLSPIGGYGHLGQYERQVTPINLIELVSTDTCPSVEPRGQSFR